MSRKETHWNWFWSIFFMWESNLFCSFLLSPDLLNRLLLWSRKRVWRVSFIFLLSKEYPILSIHAKYVSYSYFGKPCFFSIFSIKKKEISRFCLFLFSRVLTSVLILLILLDPLNLKNSITPRGNISQKPYFFISFAPVSFFSCNSLNPKKDKESFTREDFTWLLS